jgi:hypothetical protein
VEVHDCGSDGPIFGEQVTSTLSDRTRSKHGDDGELGTLLDDAVRRTVRQLNSLCKAATLQRSGQGRSRIKRRRKAHRLSHTLRRQRSAFVYCVQGPLAHRNPSGET